MLASALVILMFQAPEIATAQTAVSPPPTVSVSAASISATVQPSDRYQPRLESSSLSLNTAEPELLRVELPSTSLRGVAFEGRSALQKKLWLSLTLAQHSAATFDAWTTQRALATGRAHETNPLLRPFAGKGAIYPAINGSPFLLDYVGYRLRKSEKKWIRRFWWVPQTIQTAVNIHCAVHNLQITKTSH